jgi:hypothetical protein
MRGVQYLIYQIIKNGYNFFYLVNKFCFILVQRLSLSKFAKKQEKFLQIDFEVIKNEKQVLPETQIL